MNLVRRASAAVRLQLVLIGVVAASIALGAALGALASSPAGAATTPTLSVSSASLPADQASTISVSGAGYLVPPHAAGANVFGGVYLFFGWVQPGGAWGPSHRNGVNTDGQFGFSYSYPGEGGGGDTRDDGSGTVRLVSFTAGGASGEATPFHMDDAGNWTTTLTIRGATYTWTDITTGQSNSVNCRAVQCGVFTIGAHGKTSVTNEVFTPIAFTTGGAPVTAPPTGGISGGSTPVPTPTAPRTGTPASPTTTARPTTTVRPKGGAVTTTAVAPTTTTIVDTTSTSIVDSTTTSVDSTSTTVDSTTIAGDERAGSTVSVSSDDDGAPVGLLIGAGVGVAAIAAGAGIAVRRKFSNPTNTPQTKETS